MSFISRLKDFRSDFCQQDSVVSILFHVPPYQRPSASVSRARRQCLSLLISSKCSKGHQAAARGILEGKGKGQPRQELPSCTHSKRPTRILPVAKNLTDSKWFRFVYDRFIRR